MTYITKKQVPAHLKSDVTLLEFNHNVSYYLDSSQMYLDDFLNGGTGESVQYIGNNYLVIYEDESLKNERYFKLSDLEKMDSSELVDMLDDLENYYYDSDDRDDLINCLLQYTNEDYYNKHHDTARWWYSLDSDFTISGYSQGDAIAVKIIGNVSVDREYLSRLFYDVLVYGRVEIMANGDLLDEIYLDEYLNDEYYWDKVQVINNISKAYLNEDYHVLLVEYLTENLPEHLEYI